MRPTLYAPPPIPSYRRDNSVGTLSRSCHFLSGSCARRLSKMRETEPAGCAGRALTAIISLFGIATFAGVSGLTAVAAPAARLFQRAPEGPCRITGKVTGLGSPLPGSAVTARRGDMVHGA